ncbi:MAG: hypothetical protein JW818_06780 [Pirellulales bacterium]|nr:hypothetical protein [Pirellulales bacterium]
MHGRFCQWFTCVLLLLLSAGLTGMALGQQALPPLGATGSGYQLGTAPVHPVSMVSFETNQKSLADEVAELQAWKKKVLAKEAEAKKKAESAPSFKIMGRMYVDTAMFDQNASSIAGVGNAQNGTEFRSARLGVGGSMFQVIDYKLEMDFASSTRPTFKDVYMSINELPLLGHVRIGHFKEPFGMEQLMSSKYTTFMERSLGDAGVFVPARNIGIMAHDCSESERFTWAIGAFASESPDNPPVEQHDHEGTALTMRATFLPWYDEATEGRGLLHTGVAYSYRSIGDQSVQLRAHPESHLAPYIIDTGALAVSDMQLIGGELAYVYGPFSVQTEIYHATLDSTTAGVANANLNGCYVYVSYFLTGEHRPYKRDAGTFDRVKPFENFFRVRDENGYVHTGKGAWEVAYRYSYVDLNNGFAAGGRAGDHTLGLNWYLTPYTRMMFNYIHSTADRGANTDQVMNIFQMRAQVDF